MYGLKTLKGHITVSKNALTVILLRSINRTINLHARLESARWPPACIHKANKTSGSILYNERSLA